MGITAIKPVYDRSKKSYKVEVVTGEPNLAGLAQNGFYVTDDVARTFGYVVAGTCEWYNGLRRDAALAVYKWLLAAVKGDKAPESVGASKWKEGDRVAYETRPGVWDFGTVRHVSSGPGTVPVYAVEWDAHGSLLSNDETELVSEAEAKALPPASFPAHPTERPSKTKKA